MAACEGGAARNESSADTRSTASRPRPNALRAATGMDNIPLPLDREAFTATMRRHYPAALLAEGRSGAVLVDVSLDARGVVRCVEVVTPRVSADTVVTKVLIETDPRTGKDVHRQVDTRYDAAFGPAARAALLETRFTPPMRDGKPVDATFRMTLGFDPPDATD